MQYQVPQFIDSEDKLVGPFSLRQFMYIGAAAMVSAIGYFFLQMWLFVVVSVISLGAAGALAFLKINGRPLIKVITSAFGFYWKPQMYVWKPEHPVVTQRRAPAPAAVRELPSLQTIASGDSLHKSWENLQTGAPAAKKESTRQFVEKKMSERYQIFQRQGGDRMAARRVDYR
jgi:hypothetical protein